MRLLPLLLALGSVSSAQVLTTATVHESVESAPQASTPLSHEAEVVRPREAKAVVALPEPVVPTPNKLLSAPSGKVRALVAKYDVAKIGDRQVAAGINFFSLERETELGKQLAQLVDDSARQFTDPVVNEYVNRIAQQLVRNSDARVPFTVKLIDDDEVNAFALPGGFFYVNTGLIMAAESESELAGVMAHEIAHVAARHATRNESKAELWNFASIPLAMVGGPAAFALRAVASFAAPVTFSKFSRDAEREADLLGIEYAYVCGYDPRAMIDLFERLSGDTPKKHKGARLARAFATHPMTSDRILAAQQEITYLLPARDQYVVTTSEFDSIKARLSGLQLRVRTSRSNPDGPTLRVKDSSSRSGINTSPAQTSGPDDSQAGPVLRRRNLDHD